MNRQLFPRLVRPLSLPRFEPPRLPFRLIPRRTYITDTMESEIPSSSDRDLIFIHSLNLKATTGVDRWKLPKPQAILVSLWLKTSVALAGSTDHLPYSIHYGLLCKSVTALVEGNTFTSLEHLTEEVANLALGPELNGEWVKIAIEKPRALLRADAAGMSIVRRREGNKIVKEGEDKVFIRDLRLVTIIGVNPWERLEKQNVVLNLTLYEAVGEKYDFRKITTTVSEYVEKSDYKTVEAFVTSLAREATVTCGVEKVSVRMEKPSALTFAKAAGVEITRERSFFAAESDDVKLKAGEHNVYIALGSNLGDRYANITTAVAAMEERGIKVLRTSSLYQSAPMYVTDQPTFLNGVVSAVTTLSPEELLSTLQSIESGVLNRVKTQVNGPRTVDLDILLYDTLVMSTPSLTIPHASMLERSFVLQPLCDISPNRPHPLTSTAFKHHLSTLPTGQDPLQIYAPLTRAGSVSLDPINPLKDTLIMAILNLTPDSFSDGGATTPSNLLQKATSFLSSGASILDIGGQSTRPGAPDVGADEELRRVIPAIQALRAAGITAPISVDTYRASVAAAAVEAGADIINDISAGALDPEMLGTVAKLGVPVILGHTRGTPETMNSLAKYGDDIIGEIKGELGERVKEAEQKGVRRWNIWLDPGLGFAKGREENMRVLKELSRMTGDGLPWVLGPSRKRFTAAAGEGAKDRQWGTAAAVALSVQGGADVVRVHDVEEMKKVVDMAVAVRRC
ncbi:Dihydropteroate synthase-like protein [Pyronema domesticum]|nr:Dihydropteroate synthase-like protein [Pyronema domesticum]